MSLLSYSKLLAVPIFLILPTPQRKSQINPDPKLRWLCCIKIKIKDRKDICIQDKTPTLVHKNSVAAQLSLLKQIDWHPLMEKQMLFSLLLSLASSKWDGNFFYFFTFSVVQIFACYSLMLHQFYHHQQTAITRVQIMSWWQYSNY